MNLTALLSTRRAVEDLRASVGHAITARFKTNVEDATNSSALARELFKLREDVQILEQRTLRLEERFDTLEDQCEPEGTVRTAKTLSRESLELRSKKSP